MWRKVLRICNAEKALALIALTAFAYPLTAASTLKKESNSSITMPSSPSMPSLSAPSIGSGFYMPGSKDFYSGMTSSSGNASSSKKSSSSETVASSSESSSTQDANTNSDSARSGKSLQKPQNPQTPQLSKSDIYGILNSAAANPLSNQLTAGDISSLNNLGLFNSISGILQNGSNLSGTNPSNLDSILYSNTNADSKTLQQILSELNELKAQVAQNSNMPSGESAFITTKKIEPKILRFNINGYDILSTCRKTYFSQQEPDGTFLLTGDRRYVADGKSRSETFYFYFKACGNDEGITQYTVSPALSQDYENQNSFLYQLMTKSSLTAQRTGNLVTLRASEQNWKMDILLSLDM